MFDLLPTLARSVALALTLTVSLACSGAPSPISPSGGLAPAPPPFTDSPAVFSTLPPAPTLVPYSGLQPLPTLAPHPTLRPAEPLAPTTLDAKTPADLMRQALDFALDGDPLGVELLAATGDAAYIPVLVEFLRFPLIYFGGEVDESIQHSLNELAGLHIRSSDFGYLNADWSDWVAYIGANDDLVPPPGFTAWKGEFFSRLVDPEMGEFLYDGAPTNIRVEEIAWGGVPKDGIPDLTNPPVIPGRQATYLHDIERVFGVSFNGQHRAYPHRILNAHEMANDVVGGVPFALAY